MPSSAQAYVQLAGKGQNSLQQFPRNKSATSWRAKVRCVCCVVSFSKFHYNDLQVGNVHVYGEVTGKRA